MTEHEHEHDQQQQRRPVHSTQQEHDPLWLLLDAQAHGIGPTIERQEANGQASFVASTTLPVDMSAADRELLEQSGVQFGEPVPGDSLFQYVELPAGWSKRGTDHSMWSELVDADGNVRARIFYKAAFYDRRATLYAER